MEEQTRGRKEERLKRSLGGRKEEGNERRMERWIELWKKRRKDLGREEGWMEGRKDE